ncbi:CDP-alcohol phosphatidyltransferase-domain-containing protein [Fimicolochytrium jonesii]|uniref:CDP-alcohol phosphatidyltransferase-domain-containing protein n=1 Tax=Fimicolochytrium jonesii TaxID=1396493 RepID=UPI0022FDFB96|nr:CDP-alcohol phosphatidyltransferase-domain-containing protein [Fimicolochytrium jonesii]KAI8824210.1 CDP-alcohol phosphatidyltransferase-domain-containing protein [Fimicolochytrium jonesii]
MSFNPTKTENVFLYVPNLIGYARVALMFAALYFLPHHTLTAGALYSVSCLLDAADGQAARYFGQTSRFGAVLDMVTDRSTTSCLLVYLSLTFPRLTLIFQTLIALDLSSHYLQMYSSLVLGAGSHKNVDPKKTSWLLRQYYTNNKVLFLVCAANEAFFIALYLLGTWHVEQAKGSLVALNVGPGYPMVAAAGSGVSSVPVESDWIPKNGGGLYLTLIGLCVVTFPVCALKQFLNVVQLVGASRNLARADKAISAQNKAKSR